MKKLVVIVAVVSGTVGFAAGALLFRGHGTTRPAAPPAQTGERKILYYRNPMNPQQTSPVPRKDEMGMDYVPVYADEQGAPAAGGAGAGGAPHRGIRIDPTVVQNSGVRIEPAQVQALQKVVRATGRVGYDERRIYDINLKFGGWADKLYANFMGMRVQRGQPLMEIYSPDLVATQAEYLQALRYQRSLEAASSQARAQAHDLVSSARARLLLWDITSTEIEELESRGTPKKTLTVYAPASGVIIEKSVVQGTRVEPGVTLLRVADLSNVWVYAQIYPYDLPWVKVGQDAEVELSYLPGNALLGKVTYVDPVLDAQTRTVRARVEVQPPESGVALRPDMYATVMLRSPPLRETVVVPHQAVIHSGERDVVIVALGDGYFEPREVKLGVSSEGMDQVLAGLESGESVVISSQFLIDSESNLKAALGAMAGHAGMGGMGGMGEKPQGQEQQPAPPPTQHPQQPSPSPAPPGHEGMPMPAPQHQN